MGKSQIEQLDVYVFISHCSQHSIAQFYVLSYHIKSQKFPYSPPLFLSCQCCSHSLSVGQSASRDLASGPSRISNLQPFPPLNFHFNLPPTHPVQLSSQPSPRRNCSIGFRPPCLLSPFLRPPRSSGPAPASSSLPLEKQPHSPPSNNAEDEPPPPRRRHLPSTAPSDNPRRARPPSRSPASRNMPASPASRRIRCFLTSWLAVWVW